MSVCPSLSLCVIISCKLNISKSYERILIKYFGEVERGPRTKLLDFDGGPDSFVDRSWIIFQNSLPLAYSA